MTGVPVSLDTVATLRANFPGAILGVKDSACDEAATLRLIEAHGDLTILVQGYRRLFNQYGVILVNPARHPHVKTVEGQAFIDWLVSGEGQKAIADYRIGGEQLFFPNARGAPRS